MRVVTHCSGAWGVCGLTSSVAAGGNFVKDTGRSGTDHLGLTEAEKKDQVRQ